MPVSSQEQEIRFCTVDGARVAAAVVGVGSPLVLPAWWASNVEENWRDGRFRAFVLGLARERTVIRYDRLGTGLSEREPSAEGFTLASELRTLETVVDAFAGERFDLLGISYGGCLAAAYADAHPERVARIVTFGAYASGEEVAPPHVRDGLLGLVRAHWGLGSRLLADVWLPDATASERQALTEYQRTAATPEVAAALLEMAYDIDVREQFARLGTPLLVLHRRDDRAAPFRCATALAARAPQARLLGLDGSAHSPWYGHSDAVVEATLAFLAGGARETAPGVAAGRRADGELSQREREVLRLVASGLSDAQIAQSLQLSPHTVHRHVANVRAKLAQPTRAAAAVEATRRGLI